MAMNNDIIDKLEKEPIYVDLKNVLLLLRLSYFGMSDDKKNKTEEIYYELLKIFAKE